MNVALRTGLEQDMGHGWMVVDGKGDYGKKREEER